MSREHKASLESPVFQVLLVLLELQAFTVLRALKVPRDILAPPDSQDLMGLPDTKDTQAPLELQVNLESLEDQDPWALLDHLDHLDLLDLKGTLAFLGLQDLLA